MVKIVDLRNSYTKPFKIARAHSTCLCLACKHALWGAMAVGREKEGEPATTSAYLLYGNFGEKFPSNGTGIFCAPKTGTGLSCTIYKIPVNFSLSLDMKPGTDNANKWYRKFRWKRGKGNTSKGITFFPGKFPPGWTAPFEFSPEFPGLPYKR